MLILVVSFGASSDLITQNMGSIKASLDCLNSQNPGSLSLESKTRGALQRLVQKKISNREKMVPLRIQLCCEQCHRPTCAQWAPMSNLICALENQRSEWTDEHRDLFGALASVSLLCSSERCEKYMLSMFAFAIGCEWLQTTLNDYLYPHKARAQMEKKTGTLSTAAICMLVALLASCSSFLSTPIGDLMRSPRDYDGKHLKISGTVTEKDSLLFAKYFVLRDKTGEIHVVTSRILPNVGESVIVRGRLDEAFSFGDASALVFVEDLPEKER